MFAIRVDLARVDGCVFFVMVVWLGWGRSTVRVELAKMMSSSWIGKGRSSLVSATGHVGTLQTRLPRALPLSYTQTSIHLQLLIITIFSFCSFIICRQSDNVPFLAPATNCFSHVSGAVLVHPRNDTLQPISGIPFQPATTMIYTRTSIVRIIIPSACTTLVHPLCVVCCGIGRYQYICKPYHVFSVTWLRLS